MIKSAFIQLAAYNRWANTRIYGAALSLPDDLYRRQIGVFFGSLHATLNHLLLADRIWLKRLTGAGEHPDRLNSILYNDLYDLTRARIAEDQRLIETVSASNNDNLDEDLTYHTTSGQRHQQKLADVLLHIFNHQTHHRGQAHACVSILTGQEPPTLDLLAFQRGTLPFDLEAALARTETVSSLL